MILAINYADKKFLNAQKYNSFTAKKIGEVDRVIEYGPHMIDESFKIRNSKWFVEGDSQIGKYGLWRPLIVCDAYEKMAEGDYLIYSDAGTYFVNSVKPLIEMMEENKENILVFELPFIEKCWTKRDVFVRLNVDQAKYTESNQRLSTVFVLKKGKDSDEFIEMYKEAALEFPELFTDEENTSGLDNYPGFIQNRHNQSVLSLISKKLGIVAHRDPTEYGLHPELYFSYLIPRSCFNICTGIL